MPSKRWFALVLAWPLIAAAASWPKVPVPEATRSTMVARRMIFNGLDMQARMFRSQKSQAEIIDFYRKAWHGKTVVNPMGEAKVIGHREGDYYITIKVSDYAGGSKGEIGIVDVGDAPKHFEPGKGLPHPMGSKVFNDIRYPDDPVPARTVAMTNTLSPLQNAGYFRERLEGDGWKPDGRQRCTDPDACVQHYSRGDSHLTLVAERGRSGYSKVIINVQRP
ncbi:hypothetical protein HF690_06505 [Oleiagrimonas citrea]|jgi:hypothetical protein|uniref:Uncharacterized protein n=1 Tax=Oleiagrimonas citrea TaxID=1665687 RepID=A0A846ZM11_9GAMM|nr:hypothetical protein [Oleiagrimonas citrea]NKZ38608.1 hypothetical protein [Oleiagrimonas citrea]